MKILCVVLFTFLVFQQSINAVDNKLEDEVDDLIDLVVTLLNNATQFNQNSLNAGVKELEQFLDAANNLGPTSEKFIRDRIELAFSALNKLIDAIKANTTGVPRDVLQCFEDLEDEITDYSVGVLNETLGCVNKEIIPFAEDCISLLQHLNDSNIELAKVTQDLADCKGSDLRAICLTNAVTEIIGNFLNVSARIEPDIQKLTLEWQALVASAELCVVKELPEIVEDAVQFGNDLVACFKKDAAFYLKNLQQIKYLKKHNTIKKHRKLNKHKTSHKKIFENILKH